VVQSIVAGTNVTVDSTDPANPIVSASGGGGAGTVESVIAGAGVEVDNTDPANPIVASPLAASAVQPGDLGTAAAADTTAFDPAGSAATAQTTAEGYTDTAIASEVSRANGAYATAAQGAKADTAVQPTRTVAGHALSADVTLVKGDVGLGNVDNTADTAKPVSTAQQTALDLKANLASPAFTGNPTAPTPTAGDNDTSIATTAFVTAAVAAGGGGGGATTGLDPFLLMGA
jgi:hypothetical protein